MTGDTGSTVGPAIRARAAQAWRAGVPSWVTGALGPASWLYRAGLGVRETLYARGWLRSETLPCRVVSVGNLSVGGTGKTPMVEWVVRWLSEAGHRVAVLSRGYGGRHRGPAALVADGGRVLMLAAEAGDEPVVLARRLLRAGIPALVVVGADRLAAGARVLADPGADVLVLDDGFQQRRLRKDVEVVCVDAREPLDPGRLLPRGSLREPPAALARADLIVLTHAMAGGDSAALAAIRAHAPGVPVLRAAYRAEDVVDAGSGVVRPLDVLRGRRVLAFAGIGAPEGLAATLTGVGAVVCGLVAFPDHHRYRAKDLGRLARRARAEDAEALLTTEKDLVRLEAGMAGIAATAPPLPVWALRVHLAFDAGAGAWRDALLARVGPAPAGPGDRS